MPEKDYSHRDLTDKLGVKAGHVIAFDERAWALEPELVQRIEVKSGHQNAGAGLPVDNVFATVAPATDAVALLKAWRSKIKSSGGIWLLSHKRSQPGYVDQNELILAGKAAGVVDNKICSVSDTVSAMRFVIRREDRPRARKGRAPGAPPD